MKNEGLIDTWHDRRIAAGDKFDDEISEHLERAEIILLLVSPYFLASRYCYQIEMARALERHDAKEARVIPVILHPCDWKTAPFSKLQAVPRDGAPVSKYPNQHDAFLEISQAIRSVVSSAYPPAVFRMASGVPEVKAPERSKQHGRSSNLRVKKEFTDEERDAFLEECYQYIANFFEASLVELQVRNRGLTGKIRTLTAVHFSAEVYRNGKSVCVCGVRLGSFLKHKQIIFSREPTSTNSMNEAMDVADNGHTLFLKTSGMSQMFSGRGGGDVQLSPEGAAEIFWGMFIEPLQC